MIFYCCEKKRVPAKVMWYFPLIPRLKYLFMNKTNAKLMRWHKERKQDNMLRHPADGSQWRKVDRTFPTFANDARNIRFGLSTDGMNPFGEQSSGHSTWPVTLCIYNLPPWLCMKRKFIMMILESSIVTMISSAGRTSSGCTSKIYIIFTIDKPSTPLSSPFGFCKYHLPLH